MRHALPLAVALALGALTGCATTPRTGRCPESNDSCFTQSNCARDEQRGCVLCVCQPLFPFGVLPPSGQAATAVPASTTAVPPPAVP